MHSFYFWGMKRWYLEQFTWIYVTEKYKEKWLLRIDCDQSLKNVFS